MIPIVLYIIFGKEAEVVTFVRLNPVGGCKPRRQLWKEKYFKKRK